MLFYFSKSTALTDECRGKKSSYCARFFCLQVDRFDPFGNSECHLINSGHFRPTVSNKTLITKECCEILKESPDQISFVANQLHHDITSSFAINI